jgi:hypothetical protein
MTTITTLKWIQISPSDYESETTRNSINYLISWNDFLSRFSIMTVSSTNYFRLIGYAHDLETAKTIAQDDYDTTCS